VVYIGHFLFAIYLIYVCNGCDQGFFLLARCYVGQFSYR